MIEGKRKGTNNVRNKLYSYIVIITHDTESEDKFVNISMPINLKTQMKWEKSKNYVNKTEIENQKGLITIQVVESIVKFSSKKNPG